MHSLLAMTKPGLVELFGSIVLVAFTILYAVFKDHANDEGPRGGIPSLLIVAGMLLYAAVWLDDLADRLPHNAVVSGAVAIFAYRMAAIFGFHEWIVAQGKQMLLALALQLLGATIIFCSPISSASVEKQVLAAGLVAGAIGILVSMGYIMFIKPKEKQEENTERFVGI